ncbi:hypothetical protein P7K49_021838 [Saguinus oedipus]|uniref:ArsA/GET3 Anion-transporting ATPase-like domain-containing protein n=1 Tax=Saguinus oedipus TaxID=9490 RepID=A0ABQ9UTU1_SAGOE|nr:hypothetical protein P7K49_021838 [Saguinus oedipus]
MLSMSKKLMQEAMHAFPSINEAMNYAEVMRLVKGMNFSVVVADMVISRSRTRSNPFILQTCNVLGLGDMNIDLLSSMLKQTLPIFYSVSKQFKGPEQTTCIICDCNPEFYPCMTE